MAEKTSSSEMLQKGLFDVLYSEHKGPRTGLTNAHFLKALILIAKSGQIGRGRLGLLLDMGQGEVRTLIRRLREGRLIIVGEGGCSLSKFGQSQFEIISKLIPWMQKVDGRQLKLGKVCFALLVKGKAGMIRKGIEQRDEAIKAGGSAALTVVYLAGKFTIPMENADCESGGPSEPWTTIRSSTNLNEGDVVIITGANDETHAEYAGLAACLDLIQSK